MHNAKVKTTVLSILTVIVLASCSGWGVQPLPFDPPTPFVLPSRTPFIHSPTPVAIGPTDTQAVATATTTPTFLPTSTNMPPPTLTDAPVNTFTPTPLVNAPSLRIIILGCNTSIDITHGMGEVTNAYVTLRNNGNVELTSLIATLYALDEGREHPDKIQEIASIPVNFEVTLKMTVDSTYREESPIQVEVTSDQGLFPREGVGSCRDLGLLVPQPGGLNTPMPTNP